MIVGSVTDWTKTVNCDVAVFSPSLTDTVTVVEPYAPRLGVRLRVRLDPVPARIMALFGRRETFEEIAPTVKAEELVSASLMVNARPLADPFSRNDWSWISNRWGRVGAFV